MKIFSWIKRAFSYIFGGYERDHLVRELCRVQSFDVVSLVKNPNITQLFVIYSIGDDGSVYLLKWDKFFNGETYNAGLDYQYIYDLKTASEELYKVANYRMRLDVILKRASPTEFFTFASRACAVMNSKYPLLGLFVDERDGHLMCITDIIDDTCEVLDIDLFMTLGILHERQVFHMIRTKDLLAEYHPFQINQERLALIVSRPWNEKTLAKFLEVVALGIRKVERESYKCDLISQGLTMFNPAPPKKQPKDEMISV